LHILINLDDEVFVNSSTI